MPAREEGGLGEGSSMAPPDVMVRVRRVTRGLVATNCYMVEFDAAEGDMGAAAVDAAVWVKVGRDDSCPEVGEKYWMHFRPA